MSFTTSPMTIAPRDTSVENGIRAARLTPLIAIATLWLALPADRAQSQEPQSAVMAAPGVIGCPDGWKPVPPGVNPVLRCLPDHIVASPPPGPARIPPQGCPKGWQPVPPNVNPVLRCQPTRIAAKSPPGTRAPEPPIGCPKGWKAVPQGVNPMLRCLPNEIAATPPPGRAIPPSGCPKGWKPVPPGVNPVMRCLPGNVAPQSPGSPGSPGSPSEVRRYDIVGAFPKKLESEDAQSITADVPSKPGGRPDPGDPPPDVMLLAALPDLALVGAMTLGGASIPWGTSASVSADDAVSKEGGRCKFRYAYRTRNQGNAASAIAVNRILLDAHNGPQLAQSPLPALAVNTEHNASGHVLLKPGTWTLYVHADAALAVAESNEKNNLRRVRATVEGDCG